MEAEVRIKVDIPLTPEQQDKIDEIARYAERQVRFVIFSELEPPEL